MPARQRPNSGLFLLFLTDTGRAVDVPAAHIRVRDQGTVIGIGVDGEARTRFPSHLGYGLEGIATFNFFSSSSIVVANVSNGLAPFR